jgi:hypothetical protein
VTHPRSKINLIIATAFGLTAAVANSRDASANDDSHKCYPTGPSSTDCGSKRRYTTTIQKSGRKKKLTLRKVVRHKSAAAHKLMRTTSPDPATRNAGSPILAEQTGELGMGNQRDVVVSSSDSENSASLLGNTQDASSDAPPLETEPHETVVDAKQAYIAKTAADHDNNSIFPMLATLSGAMLASGVGWYLVRPGPRTALS